MAVTHIGLALILSLSPGFAESVEYVICPRTVCQDHQAADDVSMASIYLPQPVSVGRPQSSSSSKSSGSVHADRSVNLKNPNSVFKHVVIEKLLQSK